MTPSDPLVTTTGAPVSLEHNAFALATFVARIMLGVFLFFTLMTAVPWSFTRGPEVALGVVIAALPNLLILAAFAFLLPRGNRILAAVFALWCAWGLIQSFSGGENFFLDIVAYSHGVLSFVGLADVVRDWKAKNA